MAECDDPECLQALERLQELRNLILTICSRIDQLNIIASNMRAVALALIVAGMALVGVAIALFTNPFTAPGGIALLAAALAMLLLAAGLLARANGINGDIAEASQYLLDLRGQYTSAAAEVMQTCDPECWDLVDLNQPDCSSANRSRSAARTSPGQGCCGEDHTQTTADPGNKEAA